MHLPTLRHAGLIAARVLMFAAWFGLSVWAAGVVFYNVWGGAVLVWLYVAAMACAFVSLPILCGFASVSHTVACARTNKSECLSKNEVFRRHQSSLKLGNARLW